RHQLVEAEILHREALLDRADPSPTSRCVLPTPGGACTRTVSALRIQPSRWPRGRSPLRSAL
ncbi:MAG TPA: hypothetical protein VE650_07750, partial [Acetobacteraceae bacterium]|nr:hypothetical protein [Acetobacteraceae bacterium]